MISPSIFHSMVESNWLLRNEISSLVQKYENIQSVCISAATVRTDTEDSFRKYSLDKPYWVSGEMIADNLELETREFRNNYKDIDLFVHHPEWDKLSRETDEELIKRQLFDITNVVL